MRGLDDNVTVGTDRIPLRKPKYWTTHIYLKISTIKFLKKIGYYKAKFVYHFGTTVIFASCVKIGEKMVKVRESGEQPFVTFWVFQREETHSTFTHFFPRKNH